MNCIKLAHLVVVHTRPLVLSSWWFGNIYFWELFVSSQWPHSLLPLSHRKLSCLALNVSNKCGPLNKCKNVGRREWTRDGGPSASLHRIPSSWDYWYGWFLLLIEALSLQDLTTLMNSALFMLGRRQDLWPSCKDTDCIASLWSSCVSTTFVECLNICISSASNKLWLASSSPWYTVFCCCCCHYC